MGRVTDESEVKYGTKFEVHFKKKTVVNGISRIASIYKNARKNTTLCIASTSSIKPSLRIDQRATSYTTM